MSTLTPIFSWAVYFHFTNIKGRHWFEKRVLPDDLSIYFEWLYYDKISMCVVLVYFLTLCMSIFEKFLLDDISLTL